MHQEKFYWVSGSANAYHDELRVISYYIYEYYLVNAGQMMFLFYFKYGWEIVIT